MNLVPEALLDDVGRDLAGTEPGQPRLLRVALATRSISASTTSLGISIVMFFCVSLTSSNSVFMCDVVHLRASRYGGHSFARVAGACAPKLARRRQASEGVRKEGLEPPYPFGYQILSLARLPIPPLSRFQSSLPRLRLRPRQLRQRGLRRPQPGVALDCEQPRSSGRSRHARLSPV